MALVTTECVVELLGLDLCGHGLMQRSPSWGRAGCWSNGRSKYCSSEIKG